MIRSTTILVSIALLAVTMAHTTELTPEGRAVDTVLTYWAGNAAEWLNAG